LEIKFLEIKFLEIDTVLKLTKNRIEGATFAKWLNPAAMSVPPA